jgi:uncharacterized protein
MSSSVVSDLDLQARLFERLRRLEGSLVAFSGGVDSSYVLWAAATSLGPARVRAVLGVSASVAKTQIEQAERVAALVGVPLERLETDELDDERYRANKGDRCYFCKDTLFRAIARLEPPAGWAILDGTNEDDLVGHRPGRAAAQEHRIRSPLAELGFKKPEIRRLSRLAGLPTADAPSSPCLASRFPAGVEVTADGLRRVEAAEDVLRALGFVEFRVRNHGDHARIELHPDDFDRALDRSLRSTIASRLRALGFRFVSLDLEPFASGRGSTTGS